MARLGGLTTPTLLSNRQPIGIRRVEDLAAEARRMIANEGFGGHRPDPEEDQQNSAS